MANRGDEISLEDRQFGRFVRSLRRARGMTQEVLAERCGLSADTIRRLEGAAFSPSLNTLRKLCEGLELSVAGLFTAFEEGLPEDDTWEVVALLRGRGRTVNRQVFRLVRVWLETLVAVRG